MQVWFLLPETMLLEIILNCHPHVKPFSTPVAPGLASNKNFNALDVSPNPSAIAFVVNLPASGLTVNSSLKNDVDIYLILLFLD